MEHRELPLADAHAVPRHAFADKAALTADGSSYFANESDLWSVVVDRKAIFRLTDPVAKTWTNLVAGRKEASAVAPGVTNDIDEGYDVGSIWADTTGVDAYICINNAAGAAVWVAASSGGAPSFPLLAPNGTVGAPSYSFSSATNYGMWNNAGSNLSFSAAGTERLRLTSGGAVQLGSLGSESGPVLAPFADPNTGIWFPTADTFALSTNATEAFRINSSQQTQVILGSPSAPSIIFAGSTNTGIYAPVASNVSITTGGAERIRVALGTTTFFRTSIGATESSAALIVQNSTVAAAGAQQWSPMSTLIGSGWETDVGSSQLIQISTQLETIQGAAAPSGEWALKGKVHTGAWIDMLKVTTGGQTLVTAGAVGAPALAFIDQPNTGWYRQVANGWTFSANGIRAFDFTQNIVALSLGGETSPIYGFVDPGLGMFSPGADTLGLTTGSTECIRWNSSQQTLAVAGAVGTPAYSTAGNTDVGWFFPTDAMAITINGDEKTRWDDNFQTTTKSVGDSLGDADIAVMILNPTAAASGLQQHSPLWVLEGQGWKTNATAATQEVQFALKVVPVQGAANPTGELNFYSNINDAGFTKRFSIDSAGSIAAFGGTPPVQQVSGADLTNSVASGGTNDVIDNWTDLTTYATDAGAIRNAIYQLARKLKQINDGLRNYNLFT